LGRRVTFVLAAFDLAGGERVMAEYATALQARGWDVLAVAPPAPAPDLRARLRALKRGRLLRRGARRPSHFAASPVPHRELAEHRPVVAGDLPDADVLIASWWETAAWMAGMPAAKGAPVHFVQHYEAFDYTPKDQVDAALRLPMPKITIASWLETLLRDEFGARDVTLVPNAVDPARFFAPPRGRQPAPTVGMMYSPIYWKGAATGLDAFSRLRQRFPDARLVTFGTGDPTAELPLPPGSEHHRLPAQDRLREIYARCDVWLCPSRVEGFGLPPFEAMACRCPVVSTRTGGPADFIIDGVNGFLADVGDAAGLATHLKTVLGMAEEEWRAMSDAALATVRAYTPADAIDRFEAALLRVAERG
jgi:glycosyltransferase involved in cell wall biosynthesis